MGTVSNKRIDLEELNDELQHGNPEVSIIDLIAELKRMYAREDMLLDALRIIRDDLDDALKVYPSLQMTEVVAKVRNFANDASQ